MRRTLPTLLLFIAATSPAQVYKGVDADGRPFYSDRPQPDAVTVDLPTRTAQTQEPPADQAASDNGFLGSYDAFEIVAPTDGQTIRDAEGRVALSLLLAPPLKAEHRLVIDVDGVPAAGDLRDKTQLELTGIALGSHRLQARVVDANAVPVAATAVVHVHLREPLPAGAVP